MKLTYIPLLYKLKNALQKKKLSIKVNFNQQNLKILYFLLKNNYICSFERKTKNKRLFLIIFLKYDFNYLPTINDFSLNSTFSKKQPKQKLVNKDNVNFVVDLFTAKKNIENYNYAVLLAKFR
jgi:ribosomal protein S8